MVGSALWHASNLIEHGYKNTCARTPVHMRPPPETQPLVRAPRPHLESFAPDNLRFWGALCAGLLCSGVADLGRRPQWLLWAALLVQTGVQVGLACWADFELYRDARAVVRGQQPQLLRRFEAFLSLYLLNVLAFTGPFCLSTALDPQSVRPPVAADASILELWLEACWDLTLVASGTGFGERVPTALATKLACWGVAVTVTIGLSNVLLGAVVGEVSMYAPSLRAAAQAPLGHWGAR